MTSMPLEAVDLEEIEVVPLGPDDWEALWDLYERVFRTTEGPHPTDLSGWRRGCWPLEDVTREALEAGLFRGAFGEDGRLVGAYVLSHDLSDLGGAPAWEPLDSDGFLAIHQLAVAPEARGAGLAKRLVAAAAREARASGATALRLSTSPENLPANRLYRSLGFTEFDPVPYDYGEIPLEPWSIPYEYRL